MDQSPFNCPPLSGPFTTITVGSVYVKSGAILDCGDKQIAVLANATFIWTCVLRFAQNHKFAIFIIVMLLLCFLVQSNVTAITDFESDCVDNQIAAIANDAFIGSCCLNQLLVKIIEKLISTEQI